MEPEHNEFNTDDSAPNNFVDIPFYANFNSIFSDSTYCFESVESMQRFKKNGKDFSSRQSLRKQPNGQLSGLPLFQCKLKKDKSYFLNDLQKNLIIYKYIVIPDDDAGELSACYQAKYMSDRYFKFVCKNKYHKVAIFKVEFANIKNEGKFVRGEQTRIFNMKFRNDCLKMVFSDKQRNNSLVEVLYQQLQGLMWSLNNSRGDIFQQGYFVSDVYSLISAEGFAVAQLDNTKRANESKEFLENEFMGTLKLSNFGYANPFDAGQNSDGNFHNNEFLCDLNEKIVAMSFVLISYRRYKSSFH